MRTISITHENIYKTVACADYLIMPKLKKICENYLFNLVDHNNCLEICLFADTFTLTSVFEKAAELLSDNLWEIMDHDELKSLSKQTIAKLLRERRNKSEKLTFKSLVQWFNHNVDSQESCLFIVVDAARTFEWGKVSLENVLT